VIKERKISRGLVADNARRFILESLANGPVPSVTMMVHARSAGFADSTIVRARLDIGVKAYKGSGASAPWYWCIT
jgi:hypothetical protein